MIKPKEISKTSNKQGVRPQQIEKDYMITWLLWGISQNELLRSVLIFKGGTCLKKIHIAEYRYSEDMDFTINPELESNTSDEKIYKEFENIFADLLEVTQIRFSIVEDSKEVHQSTGSLKFYINYVGPLGGKGNHVKLDITRGEKLEFDVITGAVIHDYSDLKEEEAFTVKAYGLEEVVIEKMAALMGRTVPRDLYDFEYLTNNEGIELQDVFYEFERKAKHKGQDPADFIEKISKKKKTFESQWNENLSHQIKELPKFKDIWRKLEKLFRKLESIS